MNTDLKRDDEATVQFNDIKPGDAFLYTGVTYLRLAPWTPGDGDAARLMDGVIEHLHFNVKVTPLIGLGFKINPNPVLADVSSTKAGKTTYAQSAAGLSRFLVEHHPWPDVTNMYKFIAVDQTGEVFAYVVMPKLTKDHWSCGDGDPDGAEALGIVPDYLVGIGWQDVVLERQTRKAK